MVGLLFNIDFQTGNMNNRLIFGCFVKKVGEKMANLAGRKE